MSVLGWLAVPVAATLLAVLWVLWRSRPRPPATMNETLESYERFKQVFDGPRWREGRRDEHGRLPSARTTSDCAPEAAAGADNDQDHPADRGQARSRSRDQR